MSGKDARRAEAKRLYLDKNWTQAAIATHFSVSARTVERWASGDGWGALKQSKVIQLNERPEKSASAPAAAPAPRPRPGRSHEIDELEVVNLAIADLSSALSGSEDERSLGGLAGGLVRLLEYRRKISPPTAALLAEMVLALGISPTEFVRELRDKWQLKA